VYPKIKSIVAHFLLQSVLYVLIEKHSKGYQNTL